MIPGLIIGGVIPLLLAVRIVWKRILPNEAPEKGSPPPASIVGTHAFIETQSDLFSRLERKNALRDLRLLIEDDQKPLIFRWGDSGVGKTSLLRAGMEHILKDSETKRIYWEAVPQESMDGLCAAVVAEIPKTADTAQDAKSDNTKNAPGKLYEHIGGKNAVLVFDQFEQVTPSRQKDIFEFIRMHLETKPPYTLKLLISFRQEYLPTWRKFARSLGALPESRLAEVILEAFTPSEAKRALATILHVAGRTDVTDAKVERVIAMATNNGRVSPVDVGVFGLMIDRLKADAISSVEGEHALPMAYLELVPGRFSGDEQREIIAALLTLRDQENPLQRHASGKTMQQLSNAAHPGDRHGFESNIRQIERARILEVRGTAPVYRLPHERWIPALEQLAGITLVEVDQAARALRRRFAVWWEDKRRQNLLTGREVRLISRYVTQIHWGTNSRDRRDYFHRSKRAYGRRLTSYAFAGAAIAVGLVFGAYRLQRFARFNRALIELRSSDQETQFAAIEATKKIRNSLRFIIRSENLTPLKRSRSLGLELQPANVK